MLEPSCISMYEELMRLSEKKPKFKKKDYKYLKGTDCWTSVQDIHTMYNESWTGIRDTRADMQVEMMDMVDLMAELDFDPFNSGNS